MWKNDTFAFLSRLLKLGQFAAESTAAASIGFARQNAVFAFWSKGWREGYRNFGDLITPSLLSHYGFTPVWCPSRWATVAATGSILQNFPESYSGFIVGAGLISDMERQFPRATILAVRGHLTRQRIHASRHTPLGDPGLLSPLLLGSRQQKHYTLGIIPHYRDKQDLRVHGFRTRHPDDVLLIDVQRQPLEVLRDIDSCEHIVSSSLHGLIVADALAIPNAWIELSDKVAGGRFKYDDYHSSLGERRLPVSFTGTEALNKVVRSTRSPPSVIDHLKKGLDEAFRRLQSHRR